MKLSMLVIASVLTGAVGLIMGATAVYRWLTEGDKVVCVANEFSFGC